MELLKNKNFIYFKNGLKFYLIKDDLTTQNTCAIVNAANESLWLGGGVAGAIKKKGGPQIQNECDEIIKLKKRINIGNVEHTGVGNFKNENLKYIFHAVGPMYNGGKNNEEFLLQKTFKNCLKKANEELQIESISLPPISSGIFGYPKRACAAVFYKVLHEYIKENLNLNKELILKEIRMVIIDEETYSIFEDEHRSQQEIFNKSEYVNTYNS